MRIGRKYLVYLLCLFPFLEMPRWGYLPIINNIFLIAKLLSAMYIIVCIIICNKINSQIVLFAIYELLIIVSTYLNGGNIINAVSDGLALLVPIFLVYLYIEKYSLKKLLLPIVLIYLLYTIITFIQVLSIPWYIYTIHGLRDKYSNLFMDSYGYVFALGHPKRFSFCIIPILMFTMFLSLTDKKNWKMKGLFWLAFLVSIALFIRSWAVAAMIATTLCGCVYIFLDSKVLRKLLGFIDIWKVYIFIGILNVFLLFGGLTSIFSNLLEKLGKSTNLSGRTYVWEKAWVYISQSLILGNGLNEELTLSRFWNLSHMHNLLLNILYVGGILTLSIFICLNIIVANKLYKYRTTIEAKILTFCLLVFLIFSLTDTPDYSMFFMFYILGYNVDKLC